MKSLLTGVMLWASLSGMASAALIITADDVTLPFDTNPQTSSLEVYVQLTEGTTLPTLLGDTTYVYLPPASSAISFTDCVKTTAAHPYIFATGGQGGPQGTKSGNFIDITDYDFSGVTIPDNTGLVKINFTVAGNTPPGVYDVLISQDSLKTFLVNNATKASIPYEVFNHGSITIAPEPGLFMLFLTVALARLAYMGFKVRKRYRPM